MGLALLALWLKVTLPPGFMPASDAASLLVICTGHGAVARGSDGKAVPANRANELCAFADHAMSPPGPPTPPVLVPPHAAYLAAIPAPVRRMPPLGRRLASPPPPAQAPPKVLV